MKEINLFIDDERFPTFIWEENKNFIIKRNYNETIEYLKSLNKSPIFISFDHDLWVMENWEIGKTGYDIVKWLVEYDIKNNWKYIPNNFRFNIHSMNPIGWKNIKDYINNYLKLKNNWFKF